VSDQQIARYEKGTSKIPGPTDRLIRVLYIAKLDGHERISELLELLAELDQVESGKLEFEETKDGWQVAA